jgi:hypothetical protein
MARKKRRCATIDRGELLDMHQEAMVYRTLGLPEANSLVCSVGACLGNWPRVRRVKVAELRRRIGDFRRLYEKHRVGVRV